MLDLMLEEFPFSSLWNIGIFQLIGFVAVIYLFILPKEKDHPRWKSLLFFLGLIALYMGSGSALNIIGRIQFTGHIIQIVLLCFIAPPLLIIGMKRKILEKASQVKALAPIFRFLTKPYITLGLFFLSLYIYHHPPIFDQARVDLYGNYLYLFMLFITAILLWIPIISQKVNLKQTTIYNVICMILLLPLGGILIFSRDILYTAYTDLTTFTQAIEVCLPAGETISPELVLLLLPFEPVSEQHIGGIVWLLSGFIIFMISIWIKKIYLTKKELA